MPRDITWYMRLYKLGLFPRVIGTSNARPIMDMYFHAL